MHTAFDSELRPSFKDKFPQQSKKVKTNENIEKEGKGCHITYLRVAFTVQSNTPPNFEKKKLRKNFKTKNKGVNSELRAPFKVKFSIFRKKMRKTKKFRKMTKLTRKRKKDHIVKSKFRPSFKVKLKRKKTFQFPLF